MVFLRLLAVVLCLLPGIPVSAKDEEKEQVSVQTAYVPDRGELEFELVSLLGSAENGDQLETRLEIAYGVSRRFGVELEIPYRVHDRETALGEGLGDVELELKYTVFRAAEDAQALALGGEISLPTGDEERGPGRGELAGEIFLAYSKSLAGADLHLNFGVELEKEEEAGEEELEAELEYGAALEWELPGEVTILAAIIGESGDGSTELSLVPGIEWEWERERYELAFGLGFPIGLTGDADDWGVTAVFELELPLGEDR